MTKISRDDVVKLASLSSLQLEDAEIASLQSELESILGYVAQLDELDTESVVPAYQVTGLTNVYRQDEIVESIADREALLELAPSRVDNYIKVPKVI